MKRVDVTLFTRAGCSLCEKAKAAIRASGVAVRIAEVDIDGDPELRLRYTDDVPVIRIDGRDVFRHAVDPERFRAYVDGEREGHPMNTLASEKCVPCRGGVPPLAGEELASLTRELGGDWKVVDGHHLEKEFRFPDFAQALAFTNRVGAVAEDEGHHPDILLAWGKVRVTTWTHKIDGLTRSDFVLAAKIDALTNSRTP
ncbi:MAG: 4a-hydroxytetrahydrobiopterin dehydratase [Acidobacteria bacterium]|nr:4a-hydroxytetrahydrobiopterin dehydratase [Acidobacteriota bacterium]MBV9478733.1 4a-hydroxytetrahydrobiopterin dehydratase [Acidobacteriota bacterium]